MATLKTLLKDDNEVESIAIERATGIRITNAPYDDLSFTFVGRKLSNTVGTVDMDWDKNVVKFQQGGDITKSKDRVQASEPYLHYFQTGSAIEIFPHFHWHQYNDTDQFTVELQYRVTKIGGGYKEDQSDWSSIQATTCDGNDAFPFNLNGKDFMHQLTTFAPQIVDVDLSTEIEIMFTRVDSNGVASMYIKRFDFQRSITLTGMVDESKITSVNANKKLIPYVHQHYKYLSISRVCYCFYLE